MITQRILHLGRTPVLGLVDQAVSSSSSLLILIIAGRYLSRDEFGLFSLIWPTVLICVPLLGSLTASPLTIHFIECSASTRDAMYASSRRFALAIIGFAACTLSAGCLLFPNMDAQAASLVLALFSCRAYGDWSRRISYLRDEPTRAVLISSVSGLVPLLAPLILIDHPTLHHLLAAITLGAIAGAAIGHIRLRYGAEKSLLQSARQHWHHGKWMIGTTGAAWLANEVPTIILAWFTPYAVIGDMNGIRRIFGVTNVFLSGMASTITPRLRHAWHQQERYNPIFLQWSLLLIGSTVLASALIAAFSPWLVQAFYDGKIHHDFGYVLPVALATILVSINTMLDIRATSQGVPQCRFRATSLSLISALISTPILFYLFGTAGILWSIVVNYAIEALTTRLGRA